MLLPMTFSKVALAGALFALATPVVALAQNVPQNAPALENAALSSLTPYDRSQVQNLLALLSSKQIDAGTAAVQIDGVLSEDEVKSLVAQAKKANVDTDDAGTFIVDLAQASSK
jgi:hypothetical protein